MNKFKNIDIFSLSNQKNYINTEEISNKHILKKYYFLIDEYLSIVIEKKIHKMTDILIGFNIISHIFLILLYYTNNLNASIYHSRNGYYLFIEYIDQISQTDNQINLKSIDAIIFVYRNTIFNINKKYKSIDKNYDFLKNQINSYKNLLNLYINKYSNTNITELLNIIKEKLKKYPINCDLEIQIL